MAKKGNEMAEVHLTQTWVLLLKTREFRLILKSLGGRLNSSEEAEAEALGDRLTKLRGMKAQQALETADRLIDAVYGDRHTIDVT